MLGLYQKSLNLFLMLKNLENFNTFLEYVKLLLIKIITIKIIVIKLKKS